MTDSYAAAKRRNHKRHSGCVHRKMANARAAQARKREQGPPPDRPEQIERMAICLFTWISGRPYMRMMQLDPVTRASFRVTRNGAQIPVTCLSEASEILRKRAVSFRRYA